MLLNESLVCEYHRPCLMDISTYLHNEWMEWFVCCIFNWALTESEFLGYSFWIGKCATWCLQSVALAWFSVRPLTVGSVSWRGHRRAGRYGWISWEQILLCQVSWRVLLEVFIKPPLAVFPLTLQGGKVKSPIASAISTCLCGLSSRGEKYGLCAFCPRALVLRHR